VRLKPQKPKQQRGKEIIAEVFKEMAQPRIAKSARRKLENYWILEILTPVGIMLQTSAAHSTSAYRLIMIVM
jgi:hypothetical protein